MEHRYYEAKLLLIVVAIAMGALGASMSPMNDQSSPAHLEYDAAAKVEIAIHHTSAEIFREIASALR